MYLRVVFVLALANCPGEIQTKCHENGEGDNLG
jgi:hypothetical protein